MRKALSAHLIGFIYLYIDFWDPSSSSEERKLKFSQLCGFKKNPVGFEGAVRAKNNGVRLGLVREAPSTVGTRPPPPRTLREDPVECTVLPASLPHCLRREILP